MNKDFKYFTLFGMLIVANKLCSMIFAQRIVNVFGITLPGGIIPFCIIFMLLDIMTNHYRYENVKKIIYFNAICEFTMAAIIYLTFKIPTTASSGDQMFVAVLEPAVGIFFASLAATACSYILNCYLFSKLYFSWNGRFLGIRCVLSTALGELVFSMIWTPIYFFGKLDINAIKILVIDQYLFKVIFEIVTLPITYTLVYFLVKYERPTEIKYKNIAKKLI